MPIETLENIPNNVTLSFIIVNYKSKHYLKDCLASILLANFNFNYEVVIINNEEKPLKLEKNLGIFSIIEMSSNLGFAKACNIGAKASNGKILCFLNPDTKIIENQKISNLLDLILKKDFSIIGPKLVSKINSSEPQEWSAGSKITLWNIIKNNFGIIKSKKIWQSKKIIRADWVSGASMFVKKSDFFLIKGFDEKFFMYFEDVDFCRRMLLQNKTIAYFPNYKVLHFSGKSSQKKSIQKKYYFESQSYYLQKHSGQLTALASKIIRKICC
jgi:GT2 family glycosyltransferase